MFAARRPRPAPPPRGATVVEFALVALVFFAALLGALEVSRVLWVSNAAHDAARYGARIAVVCDLDDLDVKNRMRQRLATLADANIVVAYQPAGCTAASCDLVTVTLTNYSAEGFIPGVDFSPLLPPMTSTLTRELLSSANNPVCN